MDRIAADVLDDNFKTTLSGSSKWFCGKFVQSDVCFCIGIDIHLPGFIGSVREFPGSLIIMFTVPLALIGAMVSLVVFRSDYEYFQPDRCNHVDRAGVEERYSDCRVCQPAESDGWTDADSCEKCCSRSFPADSDDEFVDGFGILPMAIATGAGAESRVAMGIAVVGGMVCATFLSLFVIPAIYSYLSTEKGERDRGRA